MDGLRRAALPVTADRPTELRGAFEELVIGQLDRSYRLAAVILGSAVEAEDAVSEASVRAWRRRGDLRDVERFDAWFGRIVVNECRDRLRARHRRPVSEVLPEHPDHTVGAVDFRDLVHTRDAMSRAFERLDVDDRIVLVLRFWLDLPVDGIAVRLGVPGGTVKSRLHHATARLRAVLEEDR